jgi:hypothetical protein
VRILLFIAAILLSSLASPGWAAKNPDGVAVIIGNKNYSSSVPMVDYAHNDAEAFKKYVTDVLGFREGNIIDLRDATQSQLSSAFGNERTHEGKIWQYVRPNRSDVVVFYSGHGVPGQKDKRGYLLPVDANPDTPEINGYPIDLLYKNLSKIKARTTTVFLDTCFSGESAKGMLIRSASPINITAKMPLLGKGMTVITAAQGDQLASWDDKAKHGLFTEHLLEALYGKADNNGNGKVTLKEIKAYLDEEMTYVARRRFNRHQQATVMGDDAVVLASYTPGRPFKRTRVAVQEPVKQVPQPTTIAPVPQQQADVVAWQSIKNSTNIAEIEAFIVAFGESPFAVMASARLGELKKQQVAVITPSKPKAETAVELPSWFLNLPQDEHNIFTAGTATSADRKLAIDKSILNAERQLVDSIKGLVSVKMTQLLDESGAGSDYGLSIEASKVINKIYSKVNVRGYKPAEVKVLKQDEQYRAYVLLQYPVYITNRLFLFQLSKNPALEAKLQASKTFKKLSIGLGRAPKLGPPGPPVYHEFPQMVVDLKKAGNRTNYMKIKVVVEIVTRDLPFLQQKEIIIVDEIMNYLRSQTRADVAGGRGTERMRIGIGEVIASVMGNVKFEGVLFREILLQ